LFADVALVTLGVRLDLAFASPWIRPGLAPRRGCESVIPCGPCGLSHLVVQPRMSPLSPWTPGAPAGPIAPTSPLSPSVQRDLAARYHLGPLPSCAPFGTPWPLQVPAAARRARCTRRPRCTRCTPDLRDPRPAAPTGPTDRQEPTDRQTDGLRQDATGPTTVPHRPHRPPPTDRPHRPDRAEPHSLLGPRITSESTLEVPPTLESTRLILVGRIGRSAQNDLSNCAPTGSPSPLPPWLFHQAAHRYRPVISAVALGSGRFRKHRAGWRASLCRCRHCRYSPAPAKFGTPVRQGIGWRKSRILLRARVF